MQLEDEPETSCFGLCSSPASAAAVLRDGLLHSEQEKREREERIRLARLLTNLTGHYYKPHTLTEIAVNKSEDPPDSIGRAIYEAADTGDIETLQKLGQEWFANDILNWPNTDKFLHTPLYRAARQGNLECLKLLVALPGCEINKQDKDGHTPLWIAACLNRTECVKLLTALPNIEINKSDKCGKTPLMVAVVESNTDVVRELVMLAETDVNSHATSGPFKGRTPLGSTNNEAIKELLKTKGGREKN